MYQQQHPVEAAPTAAYNNPGYATAHYPNNYGSTPTTAAAGTMPYFQYPHATAAGQQAQKAPEVTLSLSEPAVTPAIAGKAVQKLVTVELKRAGFEKAEAPAVRQLEFEVEAFVQQLFQRAHEYANLANRAGAIASDLLTACEEFDLPTTELRQVAKRGKRRKREANGPKPFTVLVSNRPRSESPDLLPSDDEGSAPVIPPTLRALPSHFPSLPPKHTYMKTPASPPKKAALPSLEKKLKTAGLVQKSLQNLLIATEDSTNNEDAELLGHIVNWETGVHPRKRWKVGK